MMYKIENKRYGYLKYFETLLEAYCEMGFLKRNNLIQQNSIIKSVN